MSWSYCTPDGHAVMQAMQPRQRSKCSAAAAVSSACTTGAITNCAMRSPRRITNGVSPWLIRMTEISPR